MERIAPAALAALLAATSALPASAADRGLEGLWRRDGMPASAYGVGPEGLLAIERTGFSLGEIDCRFGAQAPQGFRAVAGPMACTVEGDRATTSVRLTLAGGKAQVSFDGATPSVYRRC